MLGCCDPGSSSYVCSFPTSKGRVRRRRNPILTSFKVVLLTMKLAVASLLLGSAAAFAPPSASNKMQVRVENLYYDDELMILGEDVNAWRRSLVPLVPISSTMCGVTMQVESKGVEHTVVEAIEDFAMGAGEKQRQHHTMKKHTHCEADRHALIAPFPSTPLTTPLSLILPSPTDGYFC